MPPDRSDFETAVVAGDRDLTEFLRESFIRGLAILLPLIVTLFVLSVVAGFLFDLLSPVVTAITGATLLESTGIVTLLTVFLFLAVVVATGVFAEYNPASSGFTEGFDDFMASIPGIGPLYMSFEEVSDLLLDSDTDSFQEVKLVEYPNEGSYVVAFKTAETAEVIADGAGREEMMTLFMPMAPNPVMGGFVIHVSTDRVVDVDLSVEQGIRSIVTSGVAIGGDPTADGPEGLSEEKMRELGSVGERHIERGGTESRSRQPAGDDVDDRPPTTAEDDR